jgi:hypothetical protein
MPLYPVYFGLALIIAGIVVRFGGPLGISRSWRDLLAPMLIAAGIVLLLLIFG